MKREYNKWHSPNLNRQMELLVYGHAGARILLFPPRMARFYEYENWKLIEVLRDKIENGFIQVFCLDSVDEESLYNFNIHPKERIARHLQYEKYILNEVIPFTLQKNKNEFLIAAGCSLGAYHAVNIALKYPQYFSKVVGMSGRYDLTFSINHYSDLFSGYQDETIYFNMPNQYMVNLTDEAILEKIRKIDIILAVGNEDSCLNSNQQLSQILLSGMILV